jgi:hypothetical protein
MPEEFQAYGRRWKELHPAWPVRDWSTVGGLGLLQNQALFDAPPPAHLHRCRADVVRLEVLWRFGGVYVDTDVEPVRPLGPLLQGVEARGASAFIVWSSNRWRGRRLVSNAVLGAAPRHPFIARAIAGLGPSVAAHPGRALAFQTVHYLTDLLGPVNRRGVTADGVLVLPEASFYPRSILQRRAGQPVQVRPETYGVHHWAHSRGLE